MISTVELDACIEIFKKHATSSGHSAKLNKAAFTTLIPTDNVSEVNSIHTKYLDYLFLLTPTGPNIDFLLISEIFH